MAGVDGSGRTRLTELRGEAPLLLRRTVPDGEPGEVQVHLVGGAAGPLGGDRLRIEIEVGAGALLCVRTVAASLALPGATGGQSRLDVAARVGAGGRLRWLPEPLIGAARCDHLSRSMVTLADGAALVWREELVCGRHGERVGDVRIDTSVWYAGRTLLRNALAVGQGSPGWAGSAVLGGASVVGTLLRVEPEWAVSGVPAAAPVGAYAARMPLAGGPGVQVSAAGTDLAVIRRALHEQAMSAQR
ncbi:urease accessory protein UreD [Micromonospora sp. NBC_01699]|uniref:urease accessory protein UreD n=1 Tax=Micromonospora sp. NBC_01699 TaxID=2975984 RepID=UPI002E314266|nr:urease accessory protein UreD [Micromonospora sp. NBC_01699]